MIRFDIQFFGGRGSGSYTAGQTTAAFGGGAGATDLNTAGWTPEAGHRSVNTDTTIKGAESRIIGLDHEQMVVIGQDGYVRAVVDGGQHAVGFTPKALQHVKGNIVTHNHPNGGTFSPADVIAAGDLGAGEIRAASKSFNKTYSLKAGKKANGKGLANAMTKSEKKLTQAWQKKLDSMVGKKYKDKASFAKQAHTHWNKIMGDWLNTNAPKYGYTYNG